MKQVKPWESAYAFRSTKPLRGSQVPIRAHLVVPTDDYLTDDFIIKQVARQHRIVIINSQWTLVGIRLKFRSAAEATKFRILYPNDCEVESQT